jgi:hypothetical protein
VGLQVAGRWVAGLWVAGFWVVSLWVAGFWVVSLWVAGLLMVVLLCEKCPTSSDTVHTGFCAYEW